MNGTTETSGVGGVIFMAVMSAVLFCVFAFAHVAFFLTPEAWRENSAGQRAWGVVGVLVLAAIAVLAVLFFAHGMEACRADEAACPRPDYR
ncbi:hypothetical protein HHL19_33180 [Streptomyces sp. R302]|uniref:hypothetical protein n=1 Tax=unclassified Streptomyces TaxID=2593676 RepID=UPI00145D1EBA|nr:MULTISPECIES: hypothetical protein [unclassified Streptomyces]NML54108.1 hypothetical protein [Streptomyces sp. R301]NML83368.1 hypothetical protein [Streptomyces sp. R302]